MYKQLFAGFALAFVLVATGAASHPASAQSTVTVPSGEAAQGPSQALVKSLSGEANELVPLTLNKTLELRLPGAVRDVIVGSPAIADVVVRSPTQLFLVGRSVGDTNVFLLDASGKIIERFEITVQPDTLSVKQALASLLPGEPIDVSASGSSIVLSGSVSSDGIVQRAQTIAATFVSDPKLIVNMMRVANEQQVMLRVRVSEVDKSAIKNLGIDWHLNNIAVGGGAVSLGQVATSNFASDAIGQIAGAATGLGPIGSLDVTLSMLEQQNLSKTLAEPNLVTVSGELANILVGGEFPVPISEQDNTISVSFKQFGIALSFLPVVLDSGRISLKVGTEVSSIDPAASITVGGLQIPGLKVRRASSVVELPSGGSIMLGGLLQNDVTNGIQGLPGLMNIPILGQLFRSNAFQHNETELVITVTTLLVKPVQPKLLSLPSDGFAPSSDLDMYFLGHLQNIYVKQAVPTGHNAPALQGPIGYIIQ
jgi:pilus assembly protein CpaC